jgi:hypothetical protein
MSINVTWDNSEKSAIRFDFEGQWSWSEFDLSVDRAHEMAKPIVSRVGYVFNFLRSAPMPHGLPLLHFRRALKYTPPNTGLTVIIAKPGCNYFDETVFAMLQKLHNKSGERITVVDSVEKARKRFIVSPQSRPYQERAHA